LEQLAHSQPDSIPNIETIRTLSNEPRTTSDARAKAIGVTLGRHWLEDADVGKVKAIKAALRVFGGSRGKHQAGVGTVLRIKAEMAANRPFDGVGEAA
jgi:hypothetical protein